MLLSMHEFLASRLDYLKDTLKQFKICLKLDVYKPKSKWSQITMQDCWFDI